MGKRSYGRNKGGRRWNVFDLVPGAIATGYKYLGGPSKTTTQQRKQRSGVGVTIQKDYKVQYRKSRMPRYKKKAWKKFTRKIIAANLKLVGTNTVIRNSSVSSTSLLSGQEWVAVHLYGSNGAVTAPGAKEAGLQDLAEINIQDNRISNVSKCVFGSGILDCTMRNTGENPLEVDVYELVYNATPIRESLGQTISLAETVTPQIPGSTGTGLTINTRGVTLFDLPMVLKQGKVKILKKTKVLLGKGETSTYQMRDARNHVFNFSDNFTTIENYCIPKMTKTLVFVHKPVIGLITSTLTVGVTRKYMYKLYEDNDDYDVVC